MRRQDGTGKQACTELNEKQPASPAAKKRKLPQSLRAAKPAPAGKRREPGRQQPLLCCGAKAAMRQQCGAEAEPPAAPGPADCTAAIAPPPAAAPAKRKLPQSFAAASAAARPAGEAHARSREPAVPLPLLDFRAHGRVVYAGTAGEAEAALARLPPGLEQAGWDIEWRATFKAGEPPRPPALMQICFDRPAAGGGATCLLLHLCHTGIGARLRAFLADPGVAKAGVSARADAHKVRQDLGVEVAGVVELTQHPVVRAELPHAGQSRSLASLTARYLGCTLAKGGTRTGDWERRPLSQEQLMYAATDALASLRVLQALQARPQPPPPPPETAPALQLPEGPLLGCEPAAWVPALPQLQRLQPSKLALHALLAQGLCLGQAASQRGIQPSTAASYLAEAVLAGHSYPWPTPGLSLPKNAPAAAAALAAELLPAGWQAGGQDLEAQLREAGASLAAFREQLSLEAADLGCLRLLLAHLWRQRQRPAPAAPSD